MLFSGLAGHAVCIYDKDLGFLQYLQYLHGRGQLRASRETVRRQTSSIAFPPGAVALMVSCMGGQTGSQ